jgi:hypothetical protein
MAITADHLALDLSALPWHAERFGAGFYLGQGKNRKPLLLVAPGRGNAVEPHVRYAASLVLTLVGGLVAKELGQLVVTGGQIIVMMTNGTVGPVAAGGPVKLDGAVGSVYVLSARHDDLLLAEPMTNRRGKLTGALIRSRPGPVPEFTLEVSSVIGSLDDNGMLAYRASLLDLMESLTLESRSHLR